MKIKFDMIGLFVKDMEAMVEFYHKLLNINVNWDGVSPYAEFQHEGIRFAMYERAKLPELLGQTPTYPEGINGSFELAIKVGKAANVDFFYQKWTNQGARAIYPPRNEPWKIRSAMVADPEGNLIEIASDFFNADDKKI